jgi:hypothetical protein
MIRQYKMVIVHSIIFVSLNFIICIVLFNYAYSFFRIHSTLYYVLLSIIHILGYVLVGGIVLLLNQLIRSNKINFIAFVYVMIIIEYFIVYESLLHRKMPLIISWVLADKDMVFRLIILTLLNYALYTQVYNRSLNREFV